MIKKLGSALIAAIIISTTSISAFAGQIDSFSGTTRTAINTAGSTGSAIENGWTTGSAINKGSSSTESAIAARKTSDFGKILREAIREGTAKDNGQFLMEITSPDKDKDSTYRKSYVLSGNSKYSDLVISIAKYNEDTGEYEPMYNTDGESSWEIGDFRLFSKEIILSEGTNKIKIISYRASQKDNAEIKDIQVNCFTIELLKESIIDRIINKTKDFGTELSENLGLKSLFDKN